MGAHRPGAPDVRKGPPRGLDVHHPREEVGLAARPREEGARPRARDRDRLPGGGRAQAPVGLAPRAPLEMVVREVLWGEGGVGLGRGLAAPREEPPLAVRPPFLDLQPFLMPQPFIAPFFLEAITSSSA